MKKKLQCFLVVMLMAVISLTPASAQKTMDVMKFSRMDNDLMARVTKPVRDQDEGKLCALIRVVTKLTDLEVRADALGIVKKEEHKGELWLYVPYGAKSLSFSHEDYFPLMYQYPLSIDEGTVYELQLGSYETDVDGNNRNLNTQMFVLTHQPDDATIYIDDMEVESEFGVFAAMMSKGEHKYKVTAPQYEEVEGAFELADMPVRETVNMQPLFGIFQLFTLPENGFNVFVDGRQVGTSPYKSERLDPGAYRIRIEKDKYYPVDTLIRLREGDELQFTCRATSFADSLFFNRELGGRRLSFGINVGYVMPFVGASSGGGFTGSPINYSLGDSREDVDYKSQSGLTAGLFADIKLYKNLYLIAGANYTLYRYKNTFDQAFEGHIYRTISNTVYYADTYNNNYEEDYTHHIIDFTAMASYRFVLTRMSSLHINAGPYISWNMSAKMKLSGSSELGGSIHEKKLDNSVDYSKSLGTFSSSDHIEGDFDLFKKKQSYIKTSEMGSSLGYEYVYEDSYEKSPFKRFNYGLKFGLTYELHGFQLSANYVFQLSNMANDEFWEGTRIPLFSQTGENAMSGYKHRLHALEIKLGYVLRY